MPFGKQLKSKCQPMKQVYRNQRMYKVTENIPGTPLKKGDIFYLDPGAERNHLEVFTGQGESRTVLNLDGTINKLKTESAKHRRIKF
jgi:filamentous hemagglutinin